MKTLLLIVLAVCSGSIFVLGAPDPADDAPSPALESTPGLTRVLSDRPFFGTKSVLTLNGDYVNSPKEDFLMEGTWTLPLTLEEMHGVVGQVGFGEAEKQGQWQLAYKWKLLTTDTAWQQLADANRGLTLSDRRTSVLKANYSLRDWWQLGVSAFTEDRLDSSADFDAVPFEFNKSQSLGFQIETTLRF